ncbi:MAG: DsrE family protein [Cytophagaceae bacterium]|jgi:uncharacterized protein involved in oxidation of intracellular sulfur|nr:DsrE family protein [Cytophagaceae bacterium]
MNIVRKALAYTITAILIAGCSPKGSNDKTSNQSTDIRTMKIGIILETKEPEKAWNAFRFANTAKSKGYEIKVFLMGEAVECEGLVHERYNVDEQLKAFATQGGEILACGTCLKSRLLEGSEFCPISTMADCIEMVAWADKVVTF